MKTKQNKIDWDKIIPELQEEFERKEKLSFLNEQTKFEHEDQQKLESLKQNISKVIFDEIKQNVLQSRSKSYTAIKKIKEIILNIEILPYQYATRSGDVHEFGKPWNHDGNQVKFKLRIPHDNLEIFSSKGEFLQSFPVSPTGEVKIENLDSGVYYLYLRGRRITDMEFGES